MCLEKSLKASNFVFDCANLLHYNCHEISLNCDGFNINSPNWLKSKRAATEPKQIMILDVFNILKRLHKITAELEKDSQRISKMKPFINK